MHTHYANILQGFRSQSGYSLWLRKEGGWDFPSGPVARLHASNAGGLGLIPGQGARSHMPQQRSRILCATMKTQAAKQVNTYKREKKRRTKNVKG